MKITKWKRFLIFIYRILWYKSMYQDMDWNYIVIKKCITYQEKVDHKSKVLKQFWHLKYFFKISLIDSKIKKLSTKTYKKSIIKIIEKIEHFTDSMVDWEEIPEENVDIDKLLENNIK